MPAKASGASPAAVPLSPVVHRGDMVFLSGMTGVMSGAQGADNGVAAQTRRTLEKIRASLQSVGASMTDVGECSVFLIDMADYAAMNAAYAEFFTVNPPARATLGVAALPGPAARVEIKCSAVLQRR